MASNLPPGISDGMIPGNTPEDVGFEKLFDKISESNLTAEEAHRRWDSQPELLAALNEMVDEFLTCESKNLDAMKRANAAIEKATLPLTPPESEDEWHARRFNQIR